MPTSPAASAKRSDRTRRPLLRTSDREDRHSRREGPGIARENTLGVPEGTSCGDVLVLGVCRGPRMGSRRHRAGRLLAYGPVNAPKFSQPRQA